MSKKGTHSLEEVVERLEALEEERAILNTLYRYGHCIDYGLEQGWVDLFTADGIFDVRPRGSPSSRHEGRDALAAFIAGHTRAPTKFHKHLLCEPLITVNGDEARVESYFVRLDESQGRAYIRAFGRYRDWLVKQDGHWRFKERIAELEARSPE